MQEDVKRYKALGDAQRLRALAFIAHATECCVCEVQEVLGLTAPTASRAVRMLEDIGWLQSRRNGKWVYYSLAELQDDETRLRELVLRKVAGQEQVQFDRARYEELEQIPICTP
ncbi:metalloregulator ArsR/SmtB family transcription factor [bacterium]|nr:metalloregulator ArsR/SmtB family transcription factor [bacterium]